MGVSAISKDGAQGDEVVGGGEFAAVGGTFEKVAWGFCGRNFVLVSSMYSHESISFCSCFCLELGVITGSWVRMVHVHATS